MRRLLQVQVHAKTPICFLSVIRETSWPTSAARIFLVDNRLLKCMARTFYPIAMQANPFAQLQGDFNQVRMDSEPAGFKTRNQTSLLQLLYPTRWCHQSLPYKAISTKSAWILKQLVSELRTKIVHCNWWKMFQILNLDRPCHWLSRSAST